MTNSVEEYDGETIVKRLSVPIGLEEMMEGLTKEVLRRKPRDVYQFSADYFGELLGIRDQGRQTGNYIFQNTCLVVTKRSRYLGKKIMCLSGF